MAVKAEQKHKKKNCQINESIKRITQKFLRDIRSSIMSLREECKIEPINQGFSITFHSEPL